MPTTSASLYEQLFALTTVMKQRVVDNFSGDSINERWTQDTGSGSPTYAMDDAVDGGFKITTGATDGYWGAIHFNDIRQYAHDGSVVIVVMQSTTSGSFNQTESGLSDVMNTGSTDCIKLRNMFQSTNYDLFTGDGSTSSKTESSITNDTSWHVHKGELDASNAYHTIDGTLETTKTTNLPDGKMEPYFFQKTNTNSGRTGNIRYLEAYNT